MGEVEGALLVPSGPSRLDRVTGIGIKIENQEQEQDQDQEWTGKASHHPSRNPSQNRHTRHTPPDKTRARTGGVNKVSHPSHRHSRRTLIATPAMQVFLIQ